MVKAVVVCPECNTKLTVQGEPGQQRKITCKKCHKKRVTLFDANDVEELSFYPLEEPYSYVSIVKDVEFLEKYYLVIEPELTTDEKKILQFIHKQLIDSLDIRFDQVEGNATEFLTHKIEDILKTYKIEITEDFKKRLMYFTNQRFIGYGKIDPLMKDIYIEDISCDGGGTPVYVFHRDFGSLRTNIAFADEKELSGFVIRLAQKCGKHISIADPLLDATMPDGSRIQMTLSTEITTRGSTFTIRKFRADPITPVDLMKYNTMSAEILAFLWMIVEHGFNALIAGGTASGKTSTLNAIALFIPREAKIVSIEETREINLPHPNWIPGVTRLGFGEVVDGKLIGEIDLFDLMKAALRQRPEYILVGEIRGREAYVLFQAMATGHITYSTIHADSTRALINRLEGKPINIPRSMMQSLDIVLLQGIYKKEGRNLRRCKQIVELIDIDPQTREVLTNTVFTWDPSEDRFMFSGKSYVLDHLQVKLGITTEEMKKEIARRVEILEWLYRNNLREFKDVARVVDAYKDNPDKLLKKIREDPHAAHLPKNTMTKTIRKHVEIISRSRKENKTQKPHQLKQKLHEISRFFSRYKPRGHKKIRREKKT